MDNINWMVLGAMVLFFITLFFLIPDLGRILPYNFRWLRVMLYLVPVILAFILSWRLHSDSHLLSALFGAVGFTILCQLALFFLHLGPVEAGLRATLLVAIGNWVPFVSILAIPLLARSGVRGVIGAVIGLAIGWGLAVILLHVLSLVRLRLF